ncbi:hypothetical protein EJ377_18865 [Chryseobacterium arthrosphaerae]|uniref:Uncharacterized protein n=1 Tax=Chryseobacterium arthrosphaerae TaxID=651561 RepID=A0A432DT94_9FLAO|nr:hypothetical protein EJ377_18865 [Chryseobacterium arthrosphaerae]
MTFFEVYCNTTNGIIVSYKGVDIKSSYLMAIGNTAVLNNSKNIHELNNLISNETFIKITNPNYQGFISEQEAITIAKLTIRQSAQYWNQVQGNLNDISTNLDVIVISCTEGITFKEKILKLIQIYFYNIFFYSMYLCKVRDFAELQKIKILSLLKGLLLLKNFNYI